MAEEARHVPLVLALTLSTGAVDAVSYSSLDHVFTANMSGNLALLGIGVVHGGAVVAGNAFACSGFVVGSIAVGRFLRTRRRPAGSMLVRGLVLELALLVPLVATLALIDVSRHDAWRLAVCFLLAAAMGVQTGLARLVAVRDVNTTVATMTLHDLAASSRLAGGDAARWRRRTVVVLALGVGAALGAVLDDEVRWAGLGAASAIVAAVAIAAGAAERRAGDRA